MEQKAGTSAILGLVFAIGSVLLAFGGNPLWGLLSGILAIPFGVFGFARSASPRVGGGLMSIGALVLAVFGLGLSVLVLVGVILF